MSAFKSKLMQSLRDRPLPPKFEHRIKYEWYRVFTWRERLQILFGYNLVAISIVAVRHNPGEPVEPRVFAATSRHTSPSAHMRDVVQSALNPTPPPADPPETPATIIPPVNSQ